MCFSLRIYIRETQCVKSGAIEGRLIFHPSLACCCFKLKVTGYHLALVFMASLSEVENGVKLFQISKTFWSIETKLICCIEDFKVFAGNWMPVLCERNQSCHARSFSDGSRALLAGLNTYPE